MTVHQFQFLQHPDVSKMFLPGNCAAPSSDGCGHPLLGVVVTVHEFSLHLEGRRGILSSNPTSAVMLGHEKGLFHTQDRGSRLNHHPGKSQTNAGNGLRTHQIILASPQLTGLIYLFSFRVGILPLLFTFIFEKFYREDKKKQNSVTT